LEAQLCAWEGSDQLHGERLNYGNYINSLWGGFNGPLRGIFGAFWPSEAVFGGTEGSMSPDMRVYVSPQKGACHPTWWCMSANITVHVSPQRSRCQPTEGCL
jgi:hypothetical protein